MEETITFSQKHLDFLLRYGQIKRSKNLTVTLGVIEKDNLPDDVVAKTHFVDLHKDPEDAFQQAVLSDITIVVPPFGRFSQPKDIILPPNVEISQLVARRHIEDVWLLWGIAKTKPGGLIMAVTSEGMLNSASRSPIREHVLAQGLEATILLGSTFSGSVINTALLMIRRNITPDKILLMDASNLQESWEWIALANALSKRAFAEYDLNVWYTDIDVSHLRSERLDPNFYHPRYLQIEPQEGYSEYILSDIADILGGRPLASLNDIDEPDSPRIPFLQVSSIAPDGKLRLDNVRYFPKTKDAETRAGFARAGDILITTAGSLGKCCIIPENLTTGVYFDTSIRRIRVDEEIATVERVYTFLQSEAAQLQIERYASGSVIPIISSSNLGSLRVFLPDDANDLDAPILATSIPQSIAQTLLDKVIEPLQKADDEDDNWREPILEVLNNAIHIIRRGRRSLDELVNQSYPLPIAIAYRRMTRASHNPYEQRSRLIELYEALTYFFYNVLFCDYLSNPELQAAYTPSDKPVKRSFERFPMEPRLSFIKDLLSVVRKNQLQIKMMELAGIELYEPLNSIREVRNNEYHSASGTPAAQKAIFEEGWRHLEPLLRDLSFLESYSLCRVDSLFSKKGQLHARIEHFRGAMYETDIQEQKIPIEDGDPKLILADQDHVILLTPEYSWLDLNPFYQVVSSEQYRYESHLCFVKQKKNGQLVGESMQFRDETTMPGYDNLRQRAIIAGLIGD
jgi:hypothetical protein